MSGIPTATSWRIVLLILAACTVGAMQVGKVAPSLPVIRSDLGLDLVSGGWIASTITLIGALSGLATGLAADRIGHRRVLALGLAFLALGSAAGGFAHTLTALLVSRAVEGVGYIALVVGSAPLVLQVSAPRDARFALSTLSAFFPAGVALALLTGPVFLTGPGWRAFWWFNAALCTLALVTLFLAVPAGIGGRRESRLDTATIGRALHRPGPWLLAAMLVLMSLSTFSLSTWFPTFLVERFGYSTSAAAYVSVIVVAGFVPFSVLGGLLLQRGVPRWALYAIAAAAIATLPVAAFASDWPAIARIAAAVAFTLVAGLIPGSTFAAVSLHARTPQQSGAVTGILVQGNTLGQFAGPPLLAALVVGLGGWEQSYPLFLAIAAAVLAVAVSIQRVERRLAPPAG